MAGQEVPAVGESLSIDELFENLEAQSIRTGDLVSGTVTAMDQEFATIQYEDFEGFVALVKGEAALAVGEAFEFFVDAVSPKILLSLHKGQRLALWKIGRAHV